jgi:hypothetical protein
MGVRLTGLGAEQHDRVLWAALGREHRSQWLKCADEHD